MKEEVYQRELLSERQYFFAVIDVVRKLGVELESEMRRPAIGWNEQSVQKMFCKNNVYRLESLESAMAEPFFAKMNYCDCSSNILDTVYIGKTQIDGYVTDWRRPLGDLFYKKQVKNISLGEKSVNIDAKRRFDISQSSIIGFEDLFDKDRDAEQYDENLSKLLSKNAGSYMKDIISTIQADQNHIIRRPLETSIKIQGVPGSGKTSVLLHRISYLLYEYNETFKPEDCLLILPNQLFSDYLKKILPQLEINKITSLTTLEIAIRILGKDYSKNKNTYADSIIVKNNKIVEAQSYFYSSKIISDLVKIHNENVVNQIRSVLKLLFENKLLQDIDIIGVKHIENEDIEQDLNKFVEKFKVRFYSLSELTIKDFNKQLTKTKKAFESKLRLINEKIESSDAITRITKDQIRTQFHEWLDTNNEFVCDLDFNNKFQDIGKLVKALEKTVKQFGENTIEKNPQSSTIAVKYREFISVINLYKPNLAAQCDVLCKTPFGQVEGVNFAGLFSRLKQSLKLSGDGAPFGEIEIKTLNKLLNELKESIDQPFSELKKLRYFAEKLRDTEKKNTLAQTIRVIVECEKLTEEKEPIVHYQKYLVDLGFAKPEYKEYIDIKLANTRKLILASDDTILCAIFSLYTGSELSHHWVKKYSNIIVDEVQDLSELEMYLLCIFSKNQVFNVAGDENQGIINYQNINKWQKLDAIRDQFYYFNNSKKVREYQSDYVEPYELNICYRSTKSVTEVCNLIIGTNIEAIYDNGCNVDFICIQSNGQKLVEVMDKNSLKRYFFCIRSIQIIAARQLRVLPKMPMS